VINLLVDSNLYYVGGVVRDELLNRDSIDIDFCYEGNAINFASQNSLDIIKRNPDFGTVRVNIDNREIDIASTRTELYPQKGHLPKVYNIGCSLQEDLKRRDFTINAMAKRTTDNELIDYFNGSSDIDKKVLRVLHKESFIDDPTRIIRGLKFSVRFGFELSPETKQLQDDYLNNINYDMSYHRVRKELIETFNLNSAECFDKFVEQKIYKLLGEDVTVHPVSGKQIQSSITDINNNVWFIYIAPFLVDQNKIRLPLTRNEKRILEWTKKLSIQEATNNTPFESKIIRGVLDNV
jgi:tRNA nucleotidyltransferase/poly(A) polymerase